MARDMSELYGPVPPRDEAERRVSTTAPRTPPGGAEFGARGALTLLRHTLPPTLRPLIEAAIPGVCTRKPSSTVNELVAGL